jgi:capsule polysaccharide export protein KpsE/RkpR
MSSKERFLYIAILFLGVYYLLNMYFSNKEKSTIEYNNEISKLSTKIDSLQSINESLTFEVDTLNTKIVALDQEINLKNSKIIALKHRTNEKINNVDLYKYDELERFFTERYRQYFDTIKKTSSPSSN